MKILGILSTLFGVALFVYSFWVSKAIFIFFNGLVSTARLYLMVAGERRRKL